jgi:hypothetical protein
MSARLIGTVATSAENSVFACTPVIPDLYAEFEGYRACFGSYAETAFVVDEVSAATPVPAAEPASAADLYFLPVSIGMIIAIVVVLILVLLMLLRKR